MDLFNKRKLRLLQKNYRASLDRENRLSRIVKFLIEEPDSDISSLIDDILSRRYMENRWSGLTKESHPSYIYNKEETEKLSKYLTEFI